MSKVCALELKNVSTLEEGMKFKNYKKLCEFLNIEPSSGNTKISQINMINNYYEIIRDGSMIIIGCKRSYKKDTNKVMIRNRTNDSQFEVDSDDIFKSGIYKIQNKDGIYIGKTINFSSRYIEHRMGKNSNRASISTTDMLKNEGVFTSLFVLDVYDNQLLLECEGYVIEYYKEIYGDFCINMCSSSPISKKYIKTIAVPDYKYEEAIKLLMDNGIL